MKSQLSLQITLEDERLAYLLENRLVCIEDLNSCDLQTKSRLKALLLRNAVKTPVG
jgi:hypothetical protein